MGRHGTAEQPPSTQRDPQRNCPGRRPHDRIASGRDSSHRRTFDGRPNPEFQNPAGPNSRNQRQPCPAGRSSANTGLPPCSSTVEWRPPSTIRPCDSERGQRAAFTRVDVNVNPRRPDASPAAIPKRRRNSRSGSPATAGLEDDAAIARRMQRVYEREAIEFADFDVTFGPGAAHLVPSPPTRSPALSAPAAAGRAPPTSSPAAAAAAASTTRHQRHGNTQRTSTERRARQITQYDEMMATELQRQFESEVTASDQRVATELAREDRQPRRRGSTRGDRPPRHRRTLPSDTRPHGRTSVGSSRAQRREAEIESGSAGSGHPLGTDIAVDVSSLVDVVVGLSKEQIRTLTVGGTQSSDAPTAPCAVCLEPIEPGEHLRRLPCLDLFHDRCVTRWLRENTVCPLCRTDVRGH